MSVTKTTPASSHEAFSYHACAIHAQSSYRELERLKKQFGSFASAWEAIRPGPEAIQAAETSWRELEKIHGRLIFWDDPDYPALLKEIPWQPFGIYLRGTLAADEMPKLAIVGTRKATPPGKEIAHHFGRTLAEHGVGIVSGLALGVDAAAHAGALEGKGYTLAVLATGIDQIYPRYNAGLAEQILAQGGGIISEYPPGAPALPYRFLERNRIVSGLTQGTFVIEAPRRSGSLATARFATEQNRSVFVLPGPANHPNFTGSHDLIRNGAELVTEPAHILESFGLANPAPIDVALHAETPEEEQVLRALEASTKPLDIDKIIELTNLRTHVITQTLSFLTIRNIVTETESGYMIKQ